MAVSIIEVPFMGSRGGLICCPRVGVNMHLRSSGVDISRSFTFIHVHLRPCMLVRVPRYVSMSLHVMFVGMSVLPSFQCFKAIGERKRMLSDRPDC